MKKIYQRPGMTVVRVQHHSLICQSVNDTLNDAGLHYRGRGNGESRVKGRGDDDWYDDWDD